MITIYKTNGSIERYPNDCWVNVFHDTVEIIQWDHCWETMEAYGEQFGDRLKTYNIEEVVAIYDGKHLKYKNNNIIK